MYIPLQLKARTELIDGALHFVVREESLVDDGALLVVGLLEPDGIGPTLLVIEVSTFRDMAARSVSNGYAVHGTSFRMEPPHIGRWADYLNAQSVGGAAASVRPARQGLLAHPVGTGDRGVPG